MKKILIILLFLFPSHLFAGDDWTRILDLRGQWKFSLGDDLSWADPGYDDGDWKTIFVPSAWEDEGFPGYDGYAWYRKTFRINSQDAEKNIYLRLWQIDDVDEVYVNGYSIGVSGAFPPHYDSAYYKDRRYRIPRYVLRTDEDNIISVRVYDDYQRGGILKGKIGIYEKNNETLPDLPLDGLWKFMLGDEEDWKDFGYDDDHWHKIMVPSHWEAQGFKKHDGYGWYRMHLVIPDEYKNKELILFLGRIDDLDQTYFNGILVGETGSRYWGEKNHSVSDEYLVWRVYALDKNIIRYGSKNIIAVRVFDDHGEGGIYNGPIGIVTKSNFHNWQLKDKVEKRKKDFFEEWFKE